MEQIFVTGKSDPFNDEFENVMDWRGMFDQTGSGSNPFYGSNMDSSGGSSAIPTPDKLPKAKITKTQYDEALKKIGDIQRDENKSDIQKNAEISAILNSLEIPHDPGSLNFMHQADQYGLLSNRIEIVDDASSSSSSTSPGDVATIIGTILGNQTPSGSNPSPSGSVPTPVAPTPVAPLQ